MSLFPKFQFSPTPAKPAKPAKDQGKFSGFSDISRERGFSENNMDYLETIYHGFTLAELEAEAAYDWQDIQHDPEQLEVFAHAIQTRRMRESGLRPAHYTKAAECTHCGPVWLWEDAPDVVMGCPWCFVRVAGKLVPRPQEGVGA